MRLADVEAPPGAWPLIGHARHLDVERLHSVFEGWADVHGPAYRIGLGAEQALVLSEPDHVADVLRRRPADFRRQSWMASVIEELGVRGVFTAEGAAWPVQRRLNMEALGKARLRDFFPVLARVTSELADLWRTEPDRDLLHDFTCFTVDVTTELAFSDRAGSLAGERSSLLRSLDPLFPAVAKRLFAVVPTWRWLRFAGDRALDAAVLEVRAYAEQLIASARNTPGRTDFVHALLEQDAGLSDDVIFGNAMTMLLAGEDTTANTLAWSLHLLLDHPEVLARLRIEADAVLGDAAIAPSYEHTKLPYAEAVVHEVMRLKPVAPILFLETVQPTRVGSIELDAGVPVVVLTRQAALRAERFPEPARFDPDRWSDPTRIAREQKAGVFVPFGSGPRICPGRALALLEVRLVLSMLAKNFDVERLGDTSAVREINGFTMRPSELGARFSPRGAA